MYVAQVAICGGRTQPRTDSCHRTDARATKRARMAGIPQDSTKEGEEDPARESGVLRISPFYDVPLFDCTMVCMLYI